MSDGVTVIVSFILTLIYLVVVIYVSSIVFDDDLILYLISLLIWLALYKIVVDFIFEFMKMRRIKKSTRT